MVVQAHPLDESCNFALLNSVSDGLDAAGADYRLSYQVQVHSWIGADNSMSVASLSLLLVEAKSERRVWLGFGRAEFHISASREERVARLRKATAKMLKEFPPNQPKS